MAKNPRNAGLTLIEVVILLLGLLLALLILVPRGNDWSTQSRRTACFSNLKQIGQLASIYAEDRQGQFPFSRAKPNPLAYESLQVLADWDPEIVQSRLFCCPAHEDRPAPRDSSGKYLLGPQSCSYAYLSAPPSLTTSPGLPLLADEKAWSEKDIPPEGHPGGRNVVYVGLSAESVPNSEIPASELPEGLIGNEPR